MHLAIVAMGIYIIFAEWRNSELRKNAAFCNKALDKFKKDKTLWYSGVLPVSSEECLMEEKDGSFIISKLADKRWMTSDGTVDFSRIKRWAYLKDLGKL